MASLKDLEELPLRSECMFDGRVLHLYRDEVLLSDGSTSVREYCKHNGGVCVVAITDEDEVLLVEQYRYAHGEVVTELPAGKLEPGEAPDLAVKRELMEETGATCGRLSFLGEMYPSPALMDEVIYMYLAEELTIGTAQLDAGEFLNSKRVPMDTLVTKILAGEIKDAKTQTAVLRAYLMRQKKG